MRLLDRLETAITEAARNVHDPIEALAFLKEAHRLVGVLREPRSGRKGINPVTIRGIASSDSDIGMNLSLVRIHLNEQKWVNASIWTGTDEKPEMLAGCCLDENSLVTGLGHLFPNGELNDPHFLRIALAERTI